MRQNACFDCSRVTQHAMALGPGGHVKLHPIFVADQPAQSVNSAIQSDPSQESVKPEFSCLAPRTSATRSRAFVRQWQHDLNLHRES